MRAKASVSGGGGCFDTSRSMMTGFGSGVSMRTFGVCKFFSALIAFAAMPGIAQAALVISKAPTSNVNCAAGVCTAVAADAVLNVKDLKTLLKANDLKVESGSAAQDIAFNATLNWTKPHRLTLDAFRSITFIQPVTAEGTGAVTLITNDGGTGGDYSFVDKGKLAFWDLSSSLIINGVGFTLVGDIATLANDIAATPSGAYALARGYDASADGVHKGAPIRTSFIGTFEGLGHSISNMIIRSRDGAGTSLGLFAVSAGTIRDINIEGANVTVLSSLYGWEVGALVGINDGNIVGSSANGGEVQEQSPESGNFGGLVGLNNGLVDRSGATIAVAGVISGGLVAANEGQIINSSAAGSIAGAAFAGGLVGINERQITNCHATGAVTSHRNVGDRGYNYIGGLVGWNHEGQISQSFAAGDAFGIDHSILGGLTGWNSRGVISQAYSLSSATSEKGEKIGGLLGLNDAGSRITEVYSIGWIMGGLHAVMGGLVGVDHAREGRIKNGYWDMETSGITNPSQGAGDPPNDPGITGLTDAQLKSGLPAGFDPAIWGQNAAINSGYPYLLANPPPQ